jgi:UDP-3-O-[3-hydroxymyristoyl] glucosamine N-acyltransferase
LCLSAMVVVGSLVVVGALVVVVDSVVVDELLQIGVMSDLALPGSTVFQCKS